MKSVLEGATGATHRITEIIDSSLSERDSFVESISSFCSSNITEPKYEEVSISLSDSLTAMGNFYQTEMKNLHNGLDEIIFFFENSVIKMTSEENVGNWQSAVYGIYISLMIIAFLLICGVVIAGLPNDNSFSEVFVCIQTWFLYPIFYIYLMVSFIGICCVILMGIVTSGKYSLALFLKNRKVAPSCILQITCYVDSFLL